MVEATNAQKMIKHEQKNGIEKVTDPRALALIDKVIQKLVRVTVADGRVYLGLLMSVDQTKTVFIQDALEVIDKDDEHYIEHELLQCHLMQRHPAGQRIYLKLVGNIVVPGRHLVKIQLDKKFQALYDEHTQPKLPSKTTP